MVNYAIEQGTADAANLAVGGWSYPRPISSLRRPTASKAAISGAGSAFFSSFYGHDEYQRDYETELGHPWENKADGEKISPFYRVNNITTPTLFMGRLERSHPRQRADVSGAPTARPHHRT